MSKQYRSSFTFTHLLLLVVIGAIIYYIATTDIASSILHPGSQVLHPATNPFPNARIHITNPAVSPMGGLMKY
jgi:hypothetical protein